MQVCCWLCVAVIDMAVAMTKIGIFQVNIIIQPLNKQSLIKEKRTTFCFPDYENSCLGNKDEHFTSCS